jgi:hypothetical protein
MRGRSGSRTNLFGSKFLHRASGSTWIRRHTGFPRVRVFSHAKPRETVLKIGSLTWTAFSSLRRGEARHCERARARTRARANLEARADAAPARFRPERETRRVSRTPDARRATAKARASRPKDRERATDAMSAALAAAQNKADLHRVTTEERLFHSEYNVPPGHAAAPNEVRWALRGYLPPKHLRIDGYNYGIPEETEAVFVEYAPDIVKRESTSALMAGCFVHDSEPAEEGMEEGISVGTITMSTSTPPPSGPGGLRGDFSFRVPLYPNGRSMTGRSRFAVRGSRTRNRVFAEFFVASRLFRFSSTVRLLRRRVRSPSLTK